MESQSLTVQYIKDVVNLQTKKLITIKILVTIPLVANLTIMERTLITTSTGLDGYRIVKQLGVVRGITVRSRSVVGNFAGGIQSLFGGRLSVYVQLCERAREEAYQLMIQHGQQTGANAIINMRYDANEVMNGITEVLAYGTAVVVEKI
jgi:uncharacterized protein YbjQ (UPF0145 family)